MAAPRLSDAQKQELVSRFRDGAGTQELASAYGCSPNTIIRVVKAAIEPALYEELKRQRGRRGAQPSAPEADLSEPNQPASEPAPAPPPQPEAAADDPADPPAPPAATAIAAESRTDGDSTADDQPAPEPESEEHDAARALAIDDADDFDDYESDDDLAGEDPEDDDDDADLPEQTFVEVPISLSETLDQPLTTPRPWRSDELPASAYMLVDKTVELQAQPLSEIPELGRLDAAELELQALVLYSNPRQAKRHCGRTQRVIKIPDVALLERRAAYLLRQGIRRVVVEGALYALPEA